MLQQLRHRHQLVACRLQVGNEARHGLDGGGMDIMHQHDGAVLHAAHDGVVHGVGIPVFPILGVHRPAHQSALGLSRHGAYLLVGAAVGQAHHLGFHTGDFQDLLPGLHDLAADLGAAQLGKVCVAPAVVGQLVAIGRHAAHRIGEGADVTTHHEEGALAAVLCKDVQQAGGVGTGAVVKGEGDHGLLRVGIGPLLGGRGLRLGFGFGLLRQGRCHGRHFLFRRGGLGHFFRRRGEGLFFLPVKHMGQGGQQEQTCQHQRKGQQSAATHGGLSFSFSLHALAPPFR